MLAQITGSLNTNYGIIRLLEGKGEAREFVVRASVGYSEHYLKHHGRFPLSDPWLHEVLQEDYRISRFEDEKDGKMRRIMAEAGITQIVIHTLTWSGRAGGAFECGRSAGEAVSRR